MKEETKKQLPSYGAILIAIAGIVTTSIQYCNTVEETRQVEISQKASNEVIVDGLSKEIERVQNDLNGLYKKTERLSIQQEFMISKCEVPANTKKASSDRVFPTDVFKSISDSDNFNISARPQLRSAEDIKEDIYQSMESK